MEKARRGKGVQCAMVIVISFQVINIVIYYTKVPCNVLFKMH